MINTLLNKARRQASGGGGGGGGFAFGNSVYGDGVNDTLSVSASTTCLNPFQQNDWAFNIWFKGSTAFQYNDVLFDFNSGGGQSYFQWRTGVGSGATSRYVWLVSNNRGTFSSWEMPTADNTDWHCIGGSVEIVDASNQKIRLYYDGALVDTIGTANNVFTRANTDQRLFGSSSGSPMVGWDKLPSWTTFQRMHTLQPHTIVEAVQTHKQPLPALSSYSYLKIQQERLQER